MKFKYVLLITFIILIPLFGQVSVIAQEEECCDDEAASNKMKVYDDVLLQQLDEMKVKNLYLKDQLKNLNAEIEALKQTLSSKDEEIDAKQSELYKLTGYTESDLPAFRKKFDETEIRINSKLGSPDEARKNYFDMIEASRVKCLSEFWDRYMEMKVKLAEWESGKYVYSDKKVYDKKIIDTKVRLRPKKRVKGKEYSAKDGEYIVVEGDNLSSIANKNHIYGNSALWNKIFNANKESVISAPSGVPKKIIDPNLIYPGQVLKIPSKEQK